LLCQLYLPLTVLAVCALHGLLSFRKSAVPRFIYSLCGAVVVSAILYPAVSYSRAEWRQLLKRPVLAQTTDVDKWILAHTDENDLIVGDGVWERRFRTGRPVLESGYPSMPPLTAPAIQAFLHQFHEQVPAAYLVCREGDSLDRTMTKYPVVFSGSNGVLVRRLEWIPGPESSNHSIGGDR
jgi:hypothetical protein